MNQENSRSFAPFAKTLLGGGNFVDILDTLKELSGLDIAFQANNGDLNLSAQSPLFIEQVKTFPRKELLRIYENRSILHNGNSTGKLIVNIPQGELHPHMKSIGNAVLALQLLMERERYALRIERRYREQCVQDLLFSRISHKEELRNRATVFGWDLSGPVTAVVAMPVDLSQKEHIHPAVRHRFRAFYPNLIFTDIGDEIAFLIPVGSDLQKEILEACRYIRDELSPLKVRLGIGDPRSSFLQAGESYREACQAIKVMDRFLQDWAIARWDELGAYKLLSSLARTDDAREFTLQKLEPLLEYDRSHNASLLDTLLIIDRSNWNLRIASKAMYVHYNTIKYRFRKICDELELNPDDSEQRFAMSLSLHIFRIIRWPGDQHKS